MAAKVFRVGAKFRWVLPVLGLVTMLGLSLIFLYLYSSRPWEKQATDDSAGTPPSPSGRLAPLPNVSAVKGQLLVYFLDVTLGDAIYVRLPSGQDVIIDGGNSPDELSTFLDYLGEKSIDVVVATHPHEDHIAGLVRVLRERDVKQVWTDGDFPATRLARDLDAAIDKSTADKRVGKAGDRFELGGVLFRFLAPNKLLSPDDSLVLRMDCGPSSFLFTGDAEFTAERGMIASQPNLAIDVLKLGHHGSKTSTSLQFLAATRPRYAVYEAELNNPYGHPNKETLERLAAVNVPVFGTGKAGGTIVVATACDDQFQILEPARGK